MNSHSASKETIACLIQNVGIKIQELYIALKKDIVIRKALDSSMPLIYSITQDIQMAIKFILMDVGVSCRALFLTENSYEKRHHMKNLLAIVSEGFKVIMNFEKSRRFALWNLLENELNNIGNSDLIDEYRRITSQLKEFGDTRIDKDIRDLTLHYDDVMIKVFEKTVSLSSEESVVSFLCNFWAILQDMLKFTYSVDDYTNSISGIVKPCGVNKVQIEVSCLHDSVRAYINQRGKLEAAIAAILPKASKQLDGMAAHCFRLQEIHKYIKENVPIFSDFTELGNLETLANHELLIRFMALDLTAVLDAYLHSCTDIEASLNLRRVVVIKTSTLVHLYGYDVGEHEKSVWKSIQAFIPSDNEDLKAGEKEIQNLLSKLVTGSKDKQLRASLVHLLDNRTHKSNIEQALFEVEKLDPAKQTAEILILMEVYKKLEAYTAKLMDTLVLNARLQREVSQKEVNDMISRIQQLIEQRNIAP